MGSRGSYRSLSGIVCSLVFLLSVLHASGDRFERAELKFDESRFLAVEHPHAAAPSAHSPQQAAQATIAGAHMTDAKGLANSDHIDLPAMPPPVSQFSFRELMSLSGEPFSESSESGSSSSESSAKKSDHFIKQLIKNMKFVAALDDPTKDQTLVDALETIKDEIVFKANSIKKQKEWVKKVHFLVRVYVKKIKRVEDHLRKLIKAARVLLRKKKQIQNMIISRKLEKRLKLIRADLEVVHAALQNAKSVEKPFNGRTKDVKKMIGSMEATIRDLRTKERKREKDKAEGNSEESSEESSSEESGSSIS